MRKLILSTVLATAAMCVAANSANAQIKVGIVDMNTVFTSYYKTKDAETKINSQRADAKKELDQRLEGLKKLMEDINKLNKDIEKPELSKDGKDKATKDRDEKITEARDLDRQIGEFRQGKEKQLQDQFLRMRKDIIDDIMAVVNDKVKAGGYDIVFDKSGASMGQIPIVLYSRADLDFSNDIITTLNKNAPKPGSAAN
ncbi:chaperone for outer membrane proteins, Skp family [Terrimicrobium sacchariphilum]|jgi:Skp family chaperone for outer membrane proteins|uniref:Chaperone for outer membrane proteins, Skp family n=1 Tax=Terrimicrobium sacchariphilum TaxID=690879 RepID=A0A146G4N3_TERSA|nr:OmpH family outer membrane protein [Terrimicrobium sacchariphilum]GAT31788.1 chaperone for outer membrane proteins, Skp family [Terrimicrobium sacchariphilum]